MMALTPLKLVTIVSDMVLQKHLLQEIRQLGARGYTVSEVHGFGMHGSHSDPIEGVNIKIEVLAAPELATRILEHLAANYFDTYPLVVYVVDVGVVRSGHFT